MRSHLDYCKGGFVLKWKVNNLFILPNGMHIVLSCPDFAMEDLPALIWKMKFVKRCNGELELQLMKQTQNVIPVHISYKVTLFDDFENEHVTIKNDRIFAVDDTLHSVYSFDSEQSRRVLQMRDITIQCHFWNNASFDKKEYVVCTARSYIAVNKLSTQFNQDCLSSMVLDQVFRYNLPLMWRSSLPLRVDMKVSKENGTIKDFHFGIRTENCYFNSEVHLKISLAGMDTGAFLEKEDRHSFSVHDVMWEFPSFCSENVKQVGLFLPDSILVTLRFQISTGEFFSFIEGIEVFSISPSEDASRNGPSGQPSNLDTEPSTKRPRQVTHPDMVAPWDISL